MQRRKRFENSKNSANLVKVQNAIRLATVVVTFHDFLPAHYTSQAVQAVMQEGVIKAPFLAVSEIPTRLSTMESVFRSYPK